MKTKNQKSGVKNYQNGFTLVEALVAITILLIGVLGPLTAATRGITDGLYAQNQLMGTYLAQEGLEFLSIKIDNNTTSINGANPVGLPVGLEDCLDTDCVVIFGSYTPCPADPVNFCFVPPVQASNGQIVFDANSSFYRPIDCMDCNFQGPTFTRILTVKILVANDEGEPEEVLLKSKVEWQNRPSEPVVQSISLYRYAFDKNAEL